MEITEFPAAWPRATRRLVNVRVNELVGGHSEATAWARTIVIGLVLRMQNAAPRHPSDDEVDAYLAGLHFTDLLEARVACVVCGHPRPEVRGETP